jgi:hypothetical protein
MDRHSRQTRLTGVGAEGQTRIARASVDVGLDGFAAEVAARYLAGAGVGCVRLRAEELGRGARASDGGVRIEVEPGLADVPGDALDLGDPAAVELARGALCALRALRSLVSLVGKSS